MFLRGALLSLAALANFSSGASVRNGEVSVNSKLGTKLLSKARKLKDNDDEEDTTWVASYSLKFHKCHTIKNVYGAEGAREAEGRIGNQQLVVFKLCPSQTCSSSCTNGGEYVVQMREFVEAYTEAKQEEQEQACELAKETCQDTCDAMDDDANDDEYCFNQCMADAGMEKCNEEEQEEDDTYPNWEFNEEEFMECREIEIGDDDGGPQYYVGPVCSHSGHAINLALFSDGACTKKVDSSVIKDYYGKSLPYEDTSMVSSKCISCLAQNDADDDYNQEPVEMCQQLHEQAGRCEKALRIPASYGTYYTPSSDACNYIHKTLPAVTKVSGSEGGALVVATAMAWTFAFACVGLVGLVYYLHKKATRAGVNLLDNQA